MNDRDYQAQWVCGKCSRSCYSCNDQKPDSCTKPINIVPAWKKYSNPVRRW